jgi:hypothetical protein
MLRDRKELEQNLSEAIINKKLKTKKKIVSDIKLHLQQYDLFEGDIQSWINDPQSYLSDLDLRVLCLLTEQVFAKTGEVNPEEYFTPHEIRDSKQFSGTLEIEQSKIDFPITLENATVVGNSAYMVTMDIRTIDLLLANKLLAYEYEVQREAKYIKRKDVITKEPTVVMKNVKEITQHLVEGTLVPTVLVFNAALRSGTGGEELIFNAKTRELTITKETFMYVVDGWHRCKAARNALQTNPELEFNFAVLITNYSTKKSQQYQAQLAKATPISKVRIQELEANRPSATVIQQLKDESDLKGKISQTNRIHSLNKEIVTYNAIADSLDELFSMDTRAEQADVGDYLVEFFNMIIGSYPEEFVYNIEETRKHSLINDNNMVGAGFIALAKNMMDNNIKARDVRKYIKNIDFSRNNEEWNRLGILDQKGNITETNKVRKTLKEYFMNINLNNNVSQT